MNNLFQYELAGSFSEQIYENNIPDHCALRTVKDHEDIMLCWGILSCIEKGSDTRCGECEYNKESKIYKNIHKV